MKLEDALAISERFLTDFSAENEGFSETGDPDDARLRFQHVEPARDGSPGILIALAAGPDEDEESPELQELADRYVEALRQAHPELASLRIDTWIFGY